MKKVAIVTIVDDYNLGNRLQNYALQYTISQLGFYCETLKNHQVLNSSDKYFLRLIKYVFLKYSDYLKKDKKRLSSFRRFNENINFSNVFVTSKNLKNTDYDFYIVGSDQVWNPNFGGLKEVDLLQGIKKSKKISFAASFGINNLSANDENRCKKNFLDFNKLSVREYQGKKILEKITDRNDIEVVVDPTMLLKASQWDNLIKKPKCSIEKKYILTYFLGELSQERKNIINKFAEEHDCDVIDVLDKKSEFYECGPSEFLYLEKNAYLICTDSFHSSVFSFIYDRPFIIFEREGSVSKMNSRLETLISQFELKNRVFNGKMITSENLYHDYKESFLILNKQREKGIKFLKDSLNCKDSD